jgi:hypothetical protein
VILILQDAFKPKEFLTGLPKLPSAYRGSVAQVAARGQDRVEQQLNSLGDNFVWIEASGRAVNGVHIGTHDTKTLVMADGKHTLDPKFLRRNIRW